MDEIRFLPCGDSAVTLSFSREIKEEVNQRIRQLVIRIQEANICGVSETVPTFSSLTVYFDPLVISRKELDKRLSLLISEEKHEKKEKKRIFQIPVCYEEEFAPDMADVCRITGLSREEVIRLHTGTDYLIYMLGFLPGFPYLGGMDPRLEVPRLDSPRTAIPAGSVGIGGKQTGIYPMASPGGWRLIGKTPVSVYDPERAEPILYRAGDAIRFFAISKEEWHAWEAGERLVEIKEELE